MWPPADLVYKNSSLSLPLNRGTSIGDEEYSLIRARYGDTTSAEAELATLEE
jgi:hypothetical protein